MAGDTGVRQDRFAAANRIQVEEDKPQKKRGTYLHPREFGMPMALGERADDASDRAAHAQAMGLSSPR